MLWMMLRHLAPSLRLVVLLVAAILAPAARAAPAAYTVVDLGLPAGAEHVEARDLNAAGAVVGNLLDDRLSQQAFYWEGGRFHFLTVDGGESVAAAINGRAQVVGRVYRAPGITQAAR